MSLGTWPLASEDDRAVLLTLVRAMPVDGRYEIEIRRTEPWTTQPPQFPAAGEQPSIPT